MVLKYNFSLTPKLLRTVYLVLSLYSFLFGGLWGADLELTATVNKERVLLGEKVILSLTLKTPADQSYRLPILKGRLGDFVIKDYQFVKAPPDKSGRESQTIAYTLVSYEVGRKGIPAIRLSDTEKKITTAPIFIQVDSVLSGNDATLEPLKPNLITRGTLNGWVYPGAVLILLIIGYLLKIIFAYIWNRRQLAYYDTACIQIEKLSREVTRQGFTKKNYFKLDQIIKKFCAEYSENPAILSMTSKQIVHSFSDQPQGLDRFFYDFFSDSDIIKFQVDDPDSISSLEKLRQFKILVDEVKRQVEEEKSAKRNSKFFFRTTDRA